MEVNIQKLQAAQFRRAAPPMLSGVLYLLAFERFVDKQFCKNVLVRYRTCTQASPC